METEILSVNQFAKMIGSSKASILRLIHEGKILAFRISDKPRARWRIKSSEIDRLISYELNKRFGGK